MLLASATVSGPLDERLPKDFGKYRLLKRIATGGMAEIFLAHERETPTQPVVVKRILPHLAESAEFVSMFLDEARIAARLAHPNIVEITDVGQVHGAYYIAMEYIHGEDVRRIYNQAYKLQRSLPLSHSIRVIAEAARGLEFAHTLEDSLTKRKVGVVHRDVSPQNILVTYGGGVKVVDFGIAKAANKVNQTRAGVLKGKYSYMSPEQALGDPIDHRTDIFALGIILYETTTGTRLFKRQNELATLQAVIKCEVIPPSDALPGYPVELEEIVLKSLAKEPRDRQQSADLLADDLYRFLHSSRLYVEPEAIADFMADLFADRLAEERASGQLVLPKEHEVRAEMEEGASIDEGTHQDDDADASGLSEPSRNTQEVSEVISSIATPSSPPPPGLAGDTHNDPRHQPQHVPGPHSVYDDEPAPGFGAGDEDSVADGTIPEEDLEDLASRSRRPQPVVAPSTTPARASTGAPAAAAPKKSSADQVATVVNQAAYRDPVTPRVIAPEKPERASGVVESTEFVRAISGARTQNGAVPPSPAVPERPSARPKPTARAAPHTSLPPSGSLGNGREAGAERSQDRPAQDRPSDRPSNRGPDRSAARASRPATQAPSSPSRRQITGLIVLFLLGVLVAVLAGLARSKTSAVGAASDETGEVTIHTEPGAVVELGDKVLGASDSAGTAGPYRLPAGPQTVRIILGPGSVRERTVHVRTGGVHEIEVRSRTGYVKLAVAPWARVKVDGKDAGVTPLPPLTLLEGEHVIVLENSDLRLRHVVDVTVEADQTVELRVDLNGVGDPY